MPNSVMLRMEMFIWIYSSFLKIKLNAHSQLSKKFVDKFCSPSFLCFQLPELTILSSRKNVSNMLC